MYSLSTKNLNKIFAVAKVSYFMKIKSVLADVFDWIDKIIHFN
jgi:hypothetical protein